MTQPLFLHEASETSFWADVEAIPVADPTVGEPAPDPVAPKVATGCRVCGDPIIRPEGARGRPPMYHPECRGQKQTAKAATRATTTTGKSKAEREADQLRDMFLRAANKGAIYAAIIDPYDGFAIAVGSREVASQLRGVLVRHDSWRQDLLSVGEGGSVLGLVLALAGIALPIMAHHGIIPKEYGGKPLGALLERMPETLHKVNSQANQAADLLADRLARAEQEASS